MVDPREIRIQQDASADIPEVTVKAWILGALARPAAEVSSERIVRDEEVVAHGVPHERRTARVTPAQMRLNTVRKLRGANAEKNAPRVAVKTVLCAVEVVVPDFHRTGRREVLLVIVIEQVEDVRALALDSEIWPDGITFEPGAANAVSDHREYRIGTWRGTRDCVLCDAVRHRLRQPNDGDVVIQALPGAGARRADAEPVVVRVHENFACRNDGAAGAAHDRARVQDDANIVARLRDVDEVSVASGVDAVARRYGVGWRDHGAAADETQLLPVFHVPDVYAYNPVERRAGNIGINAGSRGIGWRAGVNQRSHGRSAGRKDLINHCRRR